MKWLALFLCLLGLVLLGLAAKMDPKSSFDDGSFLLGILAGIAGAISLIAGISVFIFEIFELFVAL